MIGRWSDLCGGRGVCIAESDDIAAVQAWGINWAAMCEIDGQRAAARTYYTRRTPRPALTRAARSPAQ